ncbi:hypothetical protein ACFXTI_016721 [Malus domestica]
MVTSRPLAMGVGERRQAGTVRDSALPTSPRQETGPSTKSIREGLPTRGVVSDTQQRLTKRWRRRERGQVSSHKSSDAVLDEDNQTEQEVSVVSQLAGEATGIHTGDDRWDCTPSGEFLRTGAILDPTYAESSGLKRGGRFQRWEFLHNPLKKARGLEFLSNPSAVLEEIGQNLHERCLLIERAVYTKGTTMEGSSGSHRLRVGLEEVCADAHVQDKQSESSTQARSGGGWPSTAARSP